MSNYFNKVPNLDYVSRLPDANISDYIAVKNLFKKTKIREDLFQDLAAFTKWKIEGDDRPDNVAFKVYGDSTLDWLVLSSNNILNIQTEWPLTQFNFDQFLLDKYGTYDKINDTHHHETTEIKDSTGVVLLKAGLRVPSNFSFVYSDNNTTLTTNPVKEVTNLQYEDDIQDQRRNIWILKPRYLNVALDDLEKLMTYKKGSSQYVTESLKRGDNIRLFQ
tara:strand:- start:592 stop:1248 length:657 start_codon:yes stop_codon:yes gene_type:complete